MIPTLLANPTTAPFPPGHRRRPKIVAGTVKADSGQLLRGATMDLRKQTNPFSSQPAVWARFRGYGLNLVRFGVKTDHDGVGRAVAAQIPYIDAAVDLASTNNMYIMLQVSVDPGSYNMSQLQDFWSVVAPRYKDRPHVLYEMTNSPCGSGGKLTSGVYTNAVLQDLHSIYVLMRAAAPHTIILVLGCQLYPDPSTCKERVQYFEGLGSIDWASTAVAFHHYDATLRFGDPDGFGGLQIFRGWYPIFMTESSGFAAGDASADPRLDQQVWLEFERYSVSWVNLDGKDGIAPHIRDEILPYLAANGYPLPMEPVIDQDHRGRPQISNHALHTDTGRLLRGATMDIRKQTTPPCTQQAVWDHYRSLGLNLVRLGVKTDADGAGRPLAQQLPYLDAAVECARSARMYIMPLVSISPGSYDLAQLTAFWSAVAARYKDRPHVFYEMTNEPTSGGGYWGAAPHWTPAKLADLRGVYDIMRAAAPDTHIVLFSTTNLAPNPTAWRAVPQGFDAAGQPMDWSNVSIGFHHYPGTYNFGDPNGFGGIAQMQAWGYNMLMSECNDFSGDGPASDPRNKQQVWLWLEQADIPWVCLDGKSGDVLTQIEPEILPYLAANGYGLPVE